ncbi:DNA-directed RNA polymerase II subunit RPB1-like [Diaphorina citri]|jgi:hypothetical protein|uniref:DNA-directed RNA polymerase II subunit RPB1-like n=1 Tax=Diaphorina citri TaxID=121845 RepID=A0A1S3DKT0_DIACI|nr:DNA-directed RNA polymerase II subunit RPB1-like [Diaphorina citri]KAI5702895.1 hypothetical protein M8J75_005384 [Diaphorina citri]KAI5733657.1 hypothetical protein M8J76_014367 [Diaphorina citri]KAI5739682.1 hypothetical protein M8J77_022130 [Diaphorina citri]
MFKLLVLASLVALSVAAPAEVVSKSASSTLEVNKNDPLNPHDDTVVKQTSVQETVKNSDGSTTVVDKTNVASLYNPNAYLYNPFSPFYNPYNLYNPYSYYNVFNPSSPYFNPHALSPVNPRSPLFSPYTPYNPYAPINPYTGSPVPVTRSYY